MNAYFICVFVYGQMWYVCSQPYMDQIKKILFFLFASGKDLYHPCFSKIFKLFLCEKHVSWVFFMTLFMSKLSWELNGPILKIFNFG